MSQHIVQKYEHGDFTCEWVDEVLPLGEDRKAILVPSPPIEKLLSQFQDMLSELRGGTFMLPAIIMNAMKAKYGDEVWEEIEKVMYDVGYQRAKGIAETMKIDPQDARSVGRIFDLEDSQNGVKGEWVETGKKRAVKREYYCPFAPGATLCHEICTRLIASLEQGTLDGMGVKGKFALGKLISKGDPYCEAIVELED